MKRYLLGELDESEQKALEEEYFTDSQLFDKMTQVESDLVDDYVRGRLPAETRKQFEQTHGWRTYQEWLQQRASLSAPSRPTTPRRGARRRR